MTDFSKFTDEELAQIAAGNANVGPVTNAVRQVAKGVPFVGQYLDEANAATEAGLQPVIGTGNPGATFSERYNANLARENAIDKQFEQAHPWTSTGLQVGGGVASGLGAVRAAPAIANPLLGNWGTTIMPRVAGGAIMGGTMGGIAGFGKGNSIADRWLEARGGAMLGAPVGAAAAPVAHGTAAALNWLRDRASATAAGMRTGLAERPSASAVQRVAKDAEAEGFTPQTYAQQKAELGDEGMLLDMGRQFQGRAEAIAASPGKAQNTVLNAVETRVKETADRMGQELDTVLGRSPNVVQLSKGIDDHFRQTVKPAYDQAMQAHPAVWDNRLEKLTRRPSIQKAIEDAADMARELGDDITSPFVKNASGGYSLKQGATPNLAFWDYVKKSLDARIGAMARNPDPNSAGKFDYRAMLDTKNELLRHLDDITGGTYANARKLAADKFAVKEALETGLELFKNKMLPEEFAEHVSNQGIVEKAVMAAGARRALERLREVSPANMSEGGRAQYRELLQGGRDGDTAQKLRMLLGDAETDKLLSAATRETKFQSAYDKIASNSRTAVRGQLIEDLKPAVVPELTVAGAVNRAPLYPIQSYAQSVLDSMNDRTRAGAADMLTAKGAQLDPVVQALLGYLNRSRLPAGSGASGIPAAVGVATQDPRLRSIVGLPE